MESACIVASDFTGTITNGRPVETVCAGSSASRSETLSPVARAISSFLWTCPKTGSFCVISPKSWPFRVARKRHRNLADLQLQIDHRITCAQAKAAVCSAPARAVQQERGPQRGMPGEGQFLGDGKDAHLDAALALGGEVAREDERSLGEPGLARQRLHVGRREAARVGENRQLIAFQRLLREHIELHVREAAHIFLPKAPLEFFPLKRILVAHET